MSQDIKPNLKIGVMTSIIIIMGILFISYHNLSPNSYYTELFFEKSLPKIMYENISYNGSFVIYSHENKETLYRYRILLEDKVIKSGSIKLKPGERIIINFTIVPSSKWELVAQNVQIWRHVFNVSTFHVITKQNCHILLPTTLSSNLTVPNYKDGVFIPLKGFGYLSFNLSDISPQVITIQNVNLTTQEKTVMEITYEIKNITSAREIELVYKKIEKKYLPKTQKLEIIVYAGNGATYSIYQWLNIFPLIREE